MRSVSLQDPRTRQGRYRKWNAYGQSKLANLLFTFELDRRVRAGGMPVTAVAAHPGYTHTNLVDSGMNMGRRRIDAHDEPAGPRPAAPCKSAGRPVSPAPSRTRGCGRRGDIPSLAPVSARTTPAEAQPEKV